MKVTIRSIANQSLNGEVMRDTRNRTSLRSPRNIWWFIIDFSGQISFFFFSNSNYMGIINNGCCQRLSFTPQRKNYIWPKKLHNYLYLFAIGYRFRVFSSSFENLRYLSLPPRNKDNNSRDGKWRTYYTLLTMQEGWKSFTLIV